MTIHLFIITEKTKSSKLRSVKQHLSEQNIFPLNWCYDAGMYTEFEANIAIDGGYTEAWHFK